MSARESTARRLFVRAPLAKGATLTLPSDSAHYLRDVLRLHAGERVLIFNGSQGEWQARIAVADRRSVILEAERLVRPQPAASSLIYAFAPLKQARLDYMVQKAVEMGAGRLSPVLTRRTQVRTINTARIEANAVEAAEQCGILTLPQCDPLQPLDIFLDRLPEDAPLVFCDETADPPTDLARLAALDDPAPVVLIGPEGGFAPEERAALLARRGVVRLSLGPRILRADTAAVAVLALVQAAAGDWSRADPNRSEGPGSKLA